MPILALFSSFARVISYGITLFTDNFNRTTASNLGTSSSGVAWSAVSGVWTANGTVATSATAASSYPISTASMADKSVTITLDSGGAGAGAAFWVVDANNWWALAPYQDAYTSSCGTYGSYCSSTSYGSACSAYIPFSDFGASYYSICSAYRQTSSCGGYAQTCTGYTQTGGARVLNLLSRVAGTVSTVTSVSISAAAASLKVITSGNSITGTAYSASGATGTTLGTITNTPASPNRSIQAGIILAPSVGSQGTTVDNITITVP